MKGQDGKENKNIFPSARSIGAEAEDRAAGYLREKGMRILERNFRSRRGEIDVIGVHGGYLVFVEVKYRASEGKGCPEDAVGPAKQRRICGAADYYRILHGLGEDTPVRYDVVAVTRERITWYRNAFPHIYTRG